MREKSLLALVAIAVILVAIVSLTGGGMGYMMGPWLMGVTGWMGIGMIVFWILIGVGVYLLLVSNVQPRGNENDRAFTITKERYARGEITLEEYEKIKTNLSRA